MPEATTAAPQTTTTAAPQQQQQQQRTNVDPPPKPTGPVPTKLELLRDPVTGQYTKPPEPPAPDQTTVTEPPVPADPYADLKFKIRVNGEEREIDYQTAKAQLEIGEGYKAKFGELGQKEKQLEALVQRMRMDPFTAMQALGVDPEQAAVEYLNRATALGSMSPEQRQLYEYQQRVQYEAQQLEEQKQQIAMAQQQAQEAEDLKLINATLPGMLDQAGLPRDPYIIEQVAVRLDEAVAAGLTISPEVIARAVHFTKQDTIGNARRFVSSLRGKQLADFLGPELLVEVQKYALEQYRAKAANGKPNGQPRQVAAPQKPPEKKRFMTEQEYLDAQKAKGL